MIRYYNTNIQEQETYIQIDYYSSVFTIYTTKKELYKELTKKLGKAQKIGYIKQKIVSGTWYMPFDEKQKITNVLSRKLLTEII